MERRYKINYFNGEDIVWYYGTLEGAVKYAEYMRTKLHLTKYEGKITIHDGSSLFEMGDIVAYQTWTHDVDAFGDVWYIKEDWKYIKEE